MTEQRKPLTAREIELVRGIVSGKTKQAAAMEAYNTSTPESASVIASQTLKKVNVQEALQAAFERHGITIDAATKPIADGLQAETEYYDKNGEQHTRADHTTRLKASGMAFNLMGAGRNADSGTTNFIFIAKDQREKYDLS